MERLRRTISREGLSVTVVEARHRQHSLYRALGWRHQQEYAAWAVARPYLPAAALIDESYNRFVYVRIVASLESQEGLPEPFSYEAFCDADFPAGFVDEWISAVLTINPQWDTYAKRETKEEEAGGEDADGGKAAAPETEHRPAE